MQISLENKDFKPNEKIQRASERAGKRKLQKMGNPLWGFMWRFLICCMMIDLPFWAYFHFVKGVPFLVGLQQMQDEIRSKPKKKIKEQPGEQLLATERKTTSEKLGPSQEWIDEQYKEKPKNKPETVYSWKNQEGYTEYSSIGFPQDKEYTKGRIEFH